MKLLKSSMSINDYVKFPLINREQKNKYLIY